MREIEAAGDKRLLVDNHNLIVRDSMMSVHERSQTLLREQMQVRVRLDLVALIQNNFDVDSAFLGFNQGFRDRF